jgi:hypothetical protein
METKRGHRRFQRGANGETRLSLFILTGEGHYPWDLQPQSTMTNANVEQIVSAVDGRTLTLKYKDGEKKITVGPNTPIVTYVPGDKSDIKPGAKVFIVAVKQADGTLQGRAWRFGRDTPPM